MRMKVLAAAAIASDPPRRPRRLTPYGSPEDPVRAGRAPAVLVADADPVTRAQLAALLRADDLVVVEAADEPAVKRASQGALDLAVIDADLPDASRLRRHLAPGLPIILVARSPGPVADAIAMSLDAIGVLTKPVDEDDLRTIVWNLAIPR